jgi:hypothetical protein
VNWLRKRVLHWLHGPVVLGSAPEKARDDGATLLSIMSHTESPNTVTALPIRNGFLICRRVYNPNGPDKVEATFAASAEEIGPLLIAEMAVTRLNK